MSHLSEALKKLYTRKGNRVLFLGKVSLSEVALSMWEKLGYTEIDQSVISRVINGTRLFTPKQLRVFCQTLKISSYDEEQLLYALYLDKISNLGINFGNLYKINVDTVDLIDKLLSLCKSFLNEGKHSEIQDIVDFLETYIYELIKKTRGKYFYLDLVNKWEYTLYLKGRSIASSVPSSLALNKLSTISKKINGIFSVSRNKTHLLHTYFFSAMANNIAGNYSTSVRYKSHYLRAIVKIKKVIENKPEDYDLKILASKYFLSSVIHLRDVETFLSFRRMITGSFKNTNEKQFPELLSLFGVLAKGNVILKQRDSLNLHELLYEKLHKSLKGTSVYELSVIRHYVDAYFSLQAVPRRYIEKLAQRGQFLAEVGNYNRHLKSIRRLLEKI